MATRPQPRSEGPQSGSSRARCQDSESPETGSSRPGAQRSWQRRPQDPVPRPSASCVRIQDGEQLRWSGGQWSCGPETGTAAPTPGSVSPLLFSPPAAAEQRHTVPKTD